MLAIEHLRGASIPTNTQLSVLDIRRRNVGPSEIETPRLAGIASTQLEIVQVLGGHARESGDLRNRDYEPPGLAGPDDELVAVDKGRRHQLGFGSGHAKVYRCISWRAPTLGRPFPFWGGLFRRFFQTR